MHKGNIKTEITGDNKIAAVRYTRKRINKKERQEKQIDEPAHTHKRVAARESQGYVCNPP